MGRRATRRSFGDDPSASQSDAAGGAGRAVPLRQSIRQADEAAWRGDRIQPYFDGKLKYASSDNCSLVFLAGEYVGEVSVDPANRRRCLPFNFLTVHHEFHSSHRFHYVSDPRRFAPSFPEDLGLFPSRDTAAMALLTALERVGKLRRFRFDESVDRGPLEWLSFSSASLACPWLRVHHDGRELAWLMVDRDRTKRRSGWYYVGPPALGARRREGEFRSRDEAALALVEALRRAWREQPERFKKGPSADLTGPAEWNAVALDLLRRLGVTKPGRRALPRRRAV